MIDWNTETKIPPMIREAATTREELSSHPLQSSLPASRTIEVLLTGATSFLGGAILKALIGLLSLRIRRIHYITVLPDEKRVILASHSVIYYLGSLFEKRLGLKASEFEHLRAITDLIIHARATSHCLNAY